ncbi:MAG: hypothetical protein LBR70_07080 [Lactobacillaceae bacterium]|jgi:NTP pyrophosphatase (non-canonical NTP hydrolase)|nr:hypothetical protein [Lactobacillaceae bacterium]
MSNLYLKENPTLKDIQEYVYKLKIERGFNTTDKVYESLLLAEEVGELIKAVRKNLKDAFVDITANPKAEDVKEEIADVLIFLLSIANMHNIDVEEAFRQKEEKNKTRVWKKN